MEESAKHFFKGADMAIQMAKAHFLIATKAAENREYGIARSLYILGAEEAVKAAILVVQSTAQGRLTEDLDEVFRSHKAKHRDLKLINFFIKFSMKQCDDMFNHEKLQAMAPGVPLSVILDTMMKQPMLKESYDWYQKQKKSTLTFDQAIAWWSQANTEKNKGFYVNKIGSDGWHNPRSYSKEDATKARLNSEVVIQYAVRFVSDCKQDVFWQVLKENPMPNDDDESKNLPE